MKQSYLGIGIGIVIVLLPSCLGDDNGTGAAGRAVNLTTVFDPCKVPNATERICGAAGSGVFFPVNPAAEASWPRVSKIREETFLHVFCERQTLSAFHCAWCAFRRTLCHPCLVTCLRVCTRCAIAKIRNFRSPRHFFPLSTCAASPLAGFLSRANSELGALVNRQVCVCIVEALSAHQKERWVRVASRAAFLSLPKKRTAYGSQHAATSN